MPEVKAGIKTTEFWVTVIVSVIPTIMSSLDKLAPEVAATIASIASVVYMVSRAVVKKNA